MGLDCEVGRKAFHGLPWSTSPDHLPTQEELLAEYERTRLQFVTEMGLDPAIEGVGEHGSLIGGPESRYV